MTKEIVLTFLSFFIISMNISPGHCQPVDLQTSVDLLYERARPLIQNIELGRPPQKVLNTVGRPDTEQRFREDSDDIEILRYDRFNTIIHLRNGTIEKWLSKFPVDPQTPATQRLYHQRKKRLKERISSGWNQQEVLATLGQPDRRQGFTEGSDILEVWGYHGFNTRIEFRNGLVDKWFFRFMP